MDMVRTPGHVVLSIALDPHDPDIFYTIEAAITHAKDKTMFWFRRFFDGYYGFRYNGLLIPRAVWLLSLKPAPGCPWGTYTYPVTLANARVQPGSSARKNPLCVRQWFR
jgi:hypothetical protein